ncbi:hypothetical protein ABFS82_13G079400 [Erythranthe guttata]|uniref:Late embryogenesis abundant protein LEA-2 subgroup domain-containing protein n=1 Tax=Erythranthe guttata TaxID=4155 RepID=A0A022QZK6_ERYGU|nr:PREDICTED: uncharacterized protein LOC105962449 [Erythranthe guttata]EYU33411.1 hypothetical protein MIMGU_mgv1a010051mg [Erythranthe guttata]|eukprot:XP_012842205.1 PREDICTED: uncharacterized protein LOC105962449 [Erythranthe guttata]
MISISNKVLVSLVLVLISHVCLVRGYINTETVVCYTKSCPCFLKRVKCPIQCPSQHPQNPKDKACFLNCNSPICKAECKHKKPNCNGPGAACLDPRFIGGDGIVFYFHGKSNQHFTLLSDRNLHINARFIGLRPAGRQRDFTWIQALGILFDNHTFSVEATKAVKWDDGVDRLKFSYDGEELHLPEGYPSLLRTSPENSGSGGGGGVEVERTSDRNGVLVVLPEVAEISITVVPVTEEDDRVHGYRIPFSDDCFAHLEVQFRFIGGLSPEVEGVLGKTYRPEFVNPAKPGVAMAIVGGEDKYRTSSLLAADCVNCVFSHESVEL